MQPGKVVAGDPVAAFANRDGVPPTVLIGTGIVVRRNVDFVADLDIS
tara:strand:- start:88 stop:228 length:141 start_codon:yes stop_codon:yes gene_type:complete